MSANLSTDFRTAQADTLHLAAVSAVPRFRLDWRIFLALILLAVLGVGLLTKPHSVPQRLQRLAWASVLATGLALGLAACGSGSKSTQGTSAGSYTASITGTSGSQTVTKQVSVTVK